MTMTSFLTLLISLLSLLIAYLAFRQSAQRERQLLILELVSGVSKYISALIKEDHTEINNNTIYSETYLKAKYLLICSKNIKIENQKLNNFRDKVRKLIQQLVGLFTEDNSKFNREGQNVILTFLSESIKKEKPQLQICLLILFLCDIKHLVRLSEDESNELKKNLRYILISSIAKPKEGFNDLLDQAITSTLSSLSLKNELYQFTVTNFRSNVNWCIRIFRLERLKEKISIL